MNFDNDKKLYESELVLNFMDELKDFIKSHPNHRQAINRLKTFALYKIYSTMDRYKDLEYQDKWKKLSH